MQITLRKVLSTFMTISRRILRRMRCFRQNSQKKSKHTFYVQQLFPESRAVYEIMWQNVVEPDRPQWTNTIRRMRFACWITKAANTRPEYVMLIAFPLQPVTRTCLRVT